MWLGFARDGLGKGAGFEIYADDAAAGACRYLLYANVEDVCCRIEDQAVRSKSWVDVDYVDTGFGGAVDDTDFVGVVTVLPEVAVAIRMAYVEGIAGFVKAQLVGLGDEVGYVGGPFTCFEIEEAEALATLTEDC